MEKTEKNKIFTEKLEELKKELGVKVSVHFDFPEYKILPVELQLALAVLSKYRIDFILNAEELDDNKK